MPVFTTVLTDLGGLHYQQMQPLLQCFVIPLSSREESPRIISTQLVPLGLYPWLLGSFQGTLGPLGDYIGSYQGYIRVILGKPLRGTTQEPLIKEIPECKYLGLAEHVSSKGYCKEARRQLVLSPLCPVGSMWVFGGCLRPKGVPIHWHMHIPERYTHSFPQGPKLPYVETNHRGSYYYKSHTLYHVGTFHLWGLGFTS